MIDIQRQKQTVDWPMPPINAIRKKYFLAEQEKFPRNVEIKYPQWRRIQNSIKQWDGMFCKNSQQLN